MLLISIRDLTKAIHLVYAFTQEEVTSLQHPILRLPMRNSLDMPLNTSLSSVIFCESFNLLLYILDVSKGPATVLFFSNDPVWMLATFDDVIRGGRQYLWLRIVYCNQKLQNQIGDGVQRGELHHSEHHFSPHHSCHIQTLLQRRPRHRFLFKKCFKRFK